MIQQQSIDEILNIPINQVIAKYVNLKQKGINYKGLCPFHKENTPSFSVSPSKGIYKCFGCGESGNAISFIMNFKNKDFISAIRAIANDHGINILTEKDSKEASEIYNQNELLYSANKIAFEWFQKNLMRKENSSVLAYVQKRWNDDMISEFGIGFAPDDWNGLKNLAKGKGISEGILLETGLISESKGKRFDYFRNRIMFPISDRNGRIVGFTGRVFSEGKSVPKYFNTPQTAIFSKGKVLYGLHLAYRFIKEKKSVILVEGNADVIRLHQIGKVNVVGSGGTSLTKEQISELKRYARTVTLIGDSDNPGQAAVLKNGKMIIEAGMFCRVIQLPDDKGKQDPDSFFTTREQFDDYELKHAQDYIIWQANSKRENLSGPEMKYNLIEELSYLISCLPADSHEIYKDELGKIIKPKKLLHDRIGLLVSDEKKGKKKETSYSIPDNVNLSDWEKYGFYKDNNCYFFKGSGGHPRRGSNFVMEPLFHIASVINSKRLFNITNEFGIKHVIEFTQKDLNTMSNFKLRVESLGNFLFEGTESDLNKLKRFLYENTKSCIEIVQLGWQKEGFWAWSNGIFNGQFIGTDHNGIVQHGEKNYYLPSSSDIYKTEDTLFVAERPFKFTSNEATLYDYSEKLIHVFGENAMFGMCFYFASLFHDHITNQCGFFPILNLFGPKGTGKTELVVSLLQFFGNQSRGPNITNTTNPALADHVALLSNACCHIDEYKNNMDYVKIEFLKGLWDGVGRTRMNMDKDKKKETTHVNCGIILSGQEMPTMDIALFSRLIFLSFNKVEYTDKEKVAFNDLKKLEKEGLSHITHELLKHRKSFTSEFEENYNKTSDELNSALNNVVIEDRIFRNWLIILASYRTLKGMTRVPWDYNNLLEIAAKLIERQNKETKKSNELSIFWDIVEFLTNDGMIREGVDFKIEYIAKLKTDKIRIATDWNPAKNVLLLYHSRIFHLYRIHGQKTKENILPMKTLESYLINSKPYLGRKASVSFKVEENRKIVEDQGVGFNMEGNSDKKITRRVTTAMAFDYDMLKISIQNIVKNEEIEEGTGEPKDDFPF